MPFLFILAQTHMTSWYELAKREGIAYDKILWHFFNAKWWLLTTRWENNFFL